jgi:hypothetical protein
MDQAWRRSAPGEAVIGWNRRGALEKAVQLSWPWLTISNAASPYTNQDHHRRKETYFCE